MSKKYFLLLSLVHVILVLSDMLLYGYQQSADSLRYIQLANEFAAFRFADAGVSCVTAPGYPLFLALIKLFTQHNRFLIALFQSAVFCLALYTLLNALHRKQLFPRPVLHLIAFLALVSPEIYQADSATLAESLCASLLLFATAGVIGGPGYGSVLTVAAACLVVTRFEYMLVVPILYGVLAVQKRYRTLFASAAILSAVLVANGVRNAQAYGRFNSFGFGGGTVIYGGNNTNGDGSWHILQNNFDYVPPPALRQLESYDSLSGDCACLKKDSLFRKLSLDAWQADALFQLKIIPTKLGKLWLIPASLEIYTEQKIFRRGLQLGAFFNYPGLWYAPYKHAFFFAGYWMYLALVVLGIWLKIRERQWTSLDFLVCSIAVAMSLAYGILFYGLGRFHVPFFPLLIVYAATALAFLDRKYMNGAVQRLVG